MKKYGLAVWHFCIFCSTETPQNVPAVQAPHIPEPEPAYQPEPEPEPEPAPSTGDFQPGPHDGQCARALYDYQAGKCTHDSDLS